MSSFTMENPSDNQTYDDTPSDSTTIVVPISNKHTHTVIFLHGREDFGEDLAQYFFDSKASDGRSLAEIFPTIKWVFPTAKLRYSAQRDFEFSSSSFAEALKGEEIISQWFDVWDIKTPDYKQELMIPGLQESIRDVVGVIREEAEIVPLERIVLGGISQGCATAIYTLLSSGLNLGGFVGLSSWLPFQDAIEKLSWDSSIEVVNETQTQDAADLETTLSALTVRQKPVITAPVFLSHSKNDETVLFTHGQGLYQNVKNLGFDVTWKEYEDGGHWIHSKHGVDDISDFLKRILDI